TIAVLVIYFGCRWLSQTKFGLVQQAIRDSENRVLFSGYAAGNYKLFIFVLAALIASVGGVLYVPRSASSTPAKWRRTNRSKPSSGSPSAAAARCWVRCSARSASTRSR